MVTLSGFDANEIEPSKGFDPIPEGKYTAIIIDSENKPNSKNTGSYLSLKFQIVDGEHKNRTLFSNLNLDNPNEQAVQIAQRDLSAICRAVEVFTPNDSAELHNKPLTIKVAVRKRGDTGELTNEIKAYEPKGGSQSTSSEPSNSKPAWMSKK